MAKNVKNNIPKSIHEMSGDKLEEILMKKKKCNKMAHEIVERLCETNIDENWILDNLQFINQTHFEDVTIERAILKLCGYPLCDNKIEKYKQQQYHISTRYNKVFDIRERKNFCSNSCYKAATYIKKQLFTSPLWFRDQEIIPKYSLLKNNKSLLGEEIVLLPYKISLEKEDSELPQKSFTAQKTKKDFLVNKNGNTESFPIKRKIKNSVKLSENENQKEMQKVDFGHQKNIMDDNASEVCHTSDLKPQKVVNEGDEMLPENLTFLQNSNNNQTESMAEDKEEKSYSSINLEKNKIMGNQDKVNNKPAKNVKHSNGKISLLESIKAVENAVFEWVSFETLFLLLGEKKIKQLLNNSSNQIEKALKLKLSKASYDDEIEKIIKLYGLFDLGTSNNSNKPNLKPLPNYKDIQEESKSLDIKVRAFYNGSLEVRNLISDPQKNKSEEMDDNNICLPLIDSHSQHFLRRKILLDKLGKVLPDLIHIFEKDYTIEVSDVKSLVSTFVLTPHNITFRPAEWTLVGLILIKLLSIKDKNLNAILKSESSHMQLDLLLTSFNLEPNYLNSFIEKLMNNNTIIEKLK